MIVLHNITVVCPRLLTVGDSVVFDFLCVLLNFVRWPCNVFDMIVSPQSVHCYLLTFLQRRLGINFGPVRIPTSKVEVKVIFRRFKVTIVTVVSYSLAGVRFHL